LSLVNSSVCIDSIRSLAMTGVVWIDSHIGTTAVAVGDPIAQARVGLQVAHTRN
jgi:hypothetical protein